MPYNAAYGNWKFKWQYFHWSPEDDMPQSAVDDLRLKSLTNARKGS